MKQKDL